MFPWKESPFLRLLPPLIAGILLQQYLPSAITFLWFAVAAAMLAATAFQLIPALHLFRLRVLTGISVNVLILCCGCLITYYNQPFNKPGWFENTYHGHGNVKVVLQEPLSKKNKSYKALAAARQLYIGDSIVHLTGNIIVYFSSNVQSSALSYGSTIIINKPLQPVKSSGNPGSFNYKRYCNFADIAYQVYLTPADFSASPTVETRVVKKLIFQCRKSVINILRRFIKGSKEAALAEALLIGYKDELDKDLVQAYSNTGVVHIIAVSGLHLGIIYWLLNLLMRPLAKKRSTKWIAVVLTLTGLWLFSLLAGAGPSVIRSAVMFSFIIIGNAFSRNGLVLNNLAASAFLLLCWNPFWLWDIGFQLSYAAVLSIVLFYKPVYNLLYVKNKLPDAIWQLNAVTLSAQVLTLPLCIYHFHQFPVLFLVANMVAVPLSSLLLLGEIILCAVSLVPFLAGWIGTSIYYSIKLLNNFIGNMNALPFASWNHLLINLPQLFLLTACIAAAAYWLMHKYKPALFTCLLCMIAFVLMRTHSFIIASRQQKMIVYNIQGKQAIDFIEGRHYYFSGDESVQADDFLRNFDLEPSRVLHRISQSDSLPGLASSGPLFLLNGKYILVVNNNTINIPAWPLDMLVLSGNTPLQFSHLLQQLQVKQVIADATNAPWRARQWQQACDSMHIPFHNVAEQGAYVANLSNQPAFDN
jgi:competence protein ComEC